MSGEEIASVGGEDKEAGAAGGEVGAVPVPADANQNGENVTIETTATTNNGGAAEESKAEGKSLYENLCNGFLELKTKSKSAHKDPVASTLGLKIKTLPVHSYVTVNFVDPSSTAGASSSPQAPTSGKFSFMSPMGTKGAPTDPKLSLNLYEKLVTIFKRDYASTLHSVPYENIRSGAPGSIQNLPVHSILAQSHGTRNTANGDSPVPSVGTSGATMGPISDPAEWHNGPYCHVYIAACENVEHYRSKVRPSIQAFVSQIEGASGVSRPSTASATSSSSSSAKGTAPGPAGNYSAHYVIVYVPIRTSGSTTTAPSEKPSDSSLMGTNRLGGAIASRMAAARRQITQSTSRELNDSIHSSTSGFISAVDTINIDATVSTDDLSASAPPPGPIAHTSKAERELFRKFTADFPNGRTCLLSTLLDAFDGTSATTTSPLKNQEWNNFLRMLGGGIVSGFRDRCRRYDEELRRLDAARANSGGSKGLSGKAGKATDSKFDLGHFFLVKESLAFTYEQMQLPAEALLQYEELRAFLPEVSGDEVVADKDSDKKEQAQKDSSKSTSEDLDSEEALVQAIAGDALGFRKRLRSVIDLGPVQQTVLQYLYSREISLVFKMKDPLEVLKRSQAFVQIMYKMKLKGTGRLDPESPDEEKTQRSVATEIWAVNFCWDVKRASDVFFEVMNVNKDESVREFSFSRLEDSHDFNESSNHEIDPVREEVERRLASRLGELMGFARLRFLRLGDSELAMKNPIRKLTTETPADMLEEWKPWVANTEDESADVLADLQIEKKETSEALMVHEDLLEGAFESEMSYETRYLEITATVARFHRLAGRRRMSSRLQAERAEIYMRRGDYKSAVRVLLPMVDVCATDRWDRCHFWHLFRLACCQRRAGKVPAYLNTLTLCFGPHLTSIAPKKASEALQKDFEAVVSHSQIATLRLGTSSFLETDLSVNQTSNGKSSMLLNFVRKKLVKSFCSVGEAVTINLNMNSHLPCPISADKIKLLLVSFERFEELFHSREPVKDEDAFETLELEELVAINPGLNSYEFKWTPMCTGVYTLATVQIQWRSACFHYDSAALRKPLLGIEVLPSEPTQTIELNPLFLIPGQTQQARISFNSGSDAVSEGTVELLCSNGLQVIPPGKDPDSGEWTSSCKVDLPHCEPGGSVVLTTMVKSAAPRLINQSSSRLLDLDPHREGAPVQTMQARVTTSYNHALYNENKNGGDPNKAWMRTTLEAMVTTLDKPAFTVDECSAYSYSDDQVLVTVLLHCNTPVPFSLKEWAISLPNYKLAESGDLNGDLFNQAIEEGEQLSLAFNCVSRDADRKPGERPMLKVVLQDEFGKTFNQLLLLNLDSFYDKMAMEAEFSGSNSIVAELTCSQTSGLVGGPVSLTYKVDGKGVATELLYRITSNESDWIVGGKVKGILDFTKEKKHTIAMYGIPVRPGILTRFPTLSVTHVTAGEGLPPTTVQSRHPDYFKSLSYVNHMALACPVGLES